MRFLSFGISSILVFYPRTIQMKQELIGTYTTFVREEETMCHVWLPEL